MIDMTNNRIPENTSKIHLIAVCGTAMGALACMLKDLGYEVTGSDRNVYPPMSDFLTQRGIKLIDGFDRDNIAYRPDLIVVGNAVTKDNPEVLGMQELGLNFCSMPQAVNRFAARGKKQILICGTHGKTTTSSIMAWILFKAGLDPSFLIGGILKNFNCNYRLGKGDHVVVEGDEYDTAFFDKGPKFLHYEPHAVALTGIEFDHADIFKDIDHILSAFDALVSGISEDSILLAFDGDSNVDGLIGGRKCRVEGYGDRPGSAWTLGDIDIRQSETFFGVCKNGLLCKNFKTKMMGRHNLFNALAAIAIAVRLGVPVESIAEAIETFEGIKRRQELRGRKRGIRILDDFAHHPTAVRETINAVKPFCPDARLIAVFEPRTNTSMRNVFQDIYPLSFDRADLVCIRKPPLLKKIPRGERFSSEKLVEDLKQRGKDAHYFADTEGIIDFLEAEARPGDTILIMSNGGFDNIHERLLESL